MSGETEVTVNLQKLNGTRIRDGIGFLSQNESGDETTRRYGRAINVEDGYHGDLEEKVKVPKCLTAKQYLEILNNHSD